MIANDNLRIEQGDHVIMFLTDKKFITDVERPLPAKPFLLVINKASNDALLFPFDYQGLIKFIPGRKMA